MIWTAEERDQLRRAILGKRSHLRRVRKDYVRYRALYSSPQIEQALAVLRADFRDTWAEYQELKRRWARLVA